MGGRFQFSSAPEAADIEINGPRAEALARAWLLDFAQWDKGELSSEHGAPVAPETLDVCKQTYYAETPAVRPDASILQDPLRAPWARAVGPWWLVSLCAPDGEVQIVLAVSAYDTDLSIENGRVRTPPVGGNWFFALGVPKGTEMVASPEDAAITAALASGAKIAGVPLLVATPMNVGAPQSARWRIELDAPATLREQHSASAVTTRVIYVSGSFFRPGRRVEVEADPNRQPSEWTTTYDAAIKVGERPRPPDWRSVSFARRSDVPVAFAPIDQQGSAVPMVSSIGGTQ